MGKVMPNGSVCLAGEKDSLQLVDANIFIILKLNGYTKYSVFPRISPFLMLVCTSEIGLQVYMMALVPVT
jgi:hypothetical protein